MTSVVDSYEERVDLELFLPFFPHLLMDLIQYVVSPLVHMSRRHDVLQHYLIPSDCTFFRESCMVQVELPRTLEQPCKIGSLDVLFVTVVCLVEDGRQGCLVRQ